MVSTLKNAALTLLACAFVAGCARTGSQTQSFMSCTVSASNVSGSSAQLFISCGGGTAPYSVTSLTVGGRVPTNISGVSTGFSASTTLSVTDSSSLNGQSGAITVADSSSDSLGSNFTFVIGSGGLSGGTGCTMAVDSPSQTVSTNQTLGFTATVSGGWGSAPYTFYSFTPGTSGVTVQNPTAQTSTSARATAYYTAAGSPTATMNVRDASGTTQSCSYTFTVSGSSTVPTTCTAANCNLTCNASVMQTSNGLIGFQMTSTTGEALTLYNLNPGAGGSISSNGNPTYITYGYGGAKTVTLQAYAANGAACNNGNVMSWNFNVSGGTSGGGAFSCTAIVNPTAVIHGQSIQASVVTSGGVGSTYLKHLYYPTNSGMTGYFISATSAIISFPIGGYRYSIQMVAADSAGNETTCTTAVNVY